MIMRSRSDGSGGRRGRSLFTLLPLPASKWVCTNGRLTGEIGVRPACRSAPAPPRSQRSRFIKNTSVTAGKQMAGPELLRPCGHSSFAFVQVRQAHSLFIILRPAPHLLPEGGKHQGYSIAGGKRGGKKSLKLSSSFTGLIRRQSVVLVCPKEGGAFAPSPWRRNSGRCGGKVGAFSPPGFVL